MDNNFFEQKVRSIDWEKYLVPEYYDSERMNFDSVEVIETLVELNQIDESDSNNDFLSRVRYAIGNDHRGTYYPAALEAIDLIIEIENNSDNATARQYAKWVLIDLHYFQLEMGASDQKLYDFISESIKDKLKPYSDPDEESENV